MQDSNTIQNESQWSAVLETLQGALSKGQYTTHFLGSTASFTANTVTVSLPPSANLPMVENQLQAQVFRAVQSATGQAYAVRFTQGEKTESKPIEADKLEPPKPRTTVKGFTPVIDALANEVGFVVAGVYGVIWRYCQMNSHTCYASQETIAGHMSIDRKTVNRHIKPLLDLGYIRCLNNHEKGKTKVYIVTNKLEIEMAWTMEAKHSDS